MKRYMKSLLFGFVVPFFAILSLFGVGYSTWYFVNDVIKEDSITVSTDITGVADFGKIVINDDKNSVEDISSSSLNSKITVESDRIHLNNPFYVHYLLPEGALISSAGNVLKFTLQLTAPGKPTMMSLEKVMPGTVLRAYSMSSRYCSTV